MQSAKWDPWSKRCIFVGYDRSAIYCLWNGHRIIRSKDVIFDETPIYLVTPPRITLTADITSLLSIIPSSVPHLNLGQSAERVYFPFEMTMNSLNETLENDGGEGIDHLHTPLNISRRNTSSPLSSLASTPKPVPNTPLREPRHQIPTKLPPGFQHTT